VNYAQRQFASSTYAYPALSTLPQSRVQFRPRRTPRLSGLGQTVAGDASKIAAAGASVTVGILGSLSAIAAGTSIAGPIGLAITGAIALGAALYQVFSGCGQTCTEATSYVNQAEPILQQNLDNYLAAPVHYYSLQQAALNNFNTAWQAVLAACGQSALGQAGVNCIADRQAGACHYKTSPGGWQQNLGGNWSYVYPGTNGSGPACWNWFIGYHDPIANDPTVVPDPVAGAADTTNSATGTGTDTGTAYTVATGSGVNANTTVGSGGTVAGGTQSGLPVPLIIGLVLAAVLMMEG
jgi:hypothetical protein